MHGGGILKALHSNNIQYFSNQGEMGTEYRNKDFCFGKGRFPLLFRPFLRDTLLFHKYVYILTSIASLSSSLPAKVGRAVPAIYTKVSSLYKHRHDISMINIYTHRARPPARPPILFEKTHAYKFSYSGVRTSFIKPEYLADASTLSF